MSDLVKNSLKLISGNLFAQAISLATTPIVTRLYTPAQFGIFSVFISVLSIVGPISTLRYHEVIVLPKAEEDAINLYFLSLLCSLSCAIVFALLLISPLLDILISFKPAIEEYIPYMWLFSSAIFLRGALDSMHSYNIRQAGFSDLAVATGLNTLGNRTLVIILGIFTRMGPWGLILGRLFGLLINLLYLMRGNIRTIQSHLSGIGARPIFRMAARYRDFPIFGTGSVLLDSIAREIPIIILIYLFSPAIAGHYGLCVTVIRMPMTVIGKSVRNVFLQSAATLADDRIQLGKDTMSFIGFISLSLLPGIALLVVLGDWLFIVLMGENWLEAGKYTQVLAPSYYFLFLYEVLSIFFIVYENPRARLLFDVIKLSARAGFLGLIAFATHSPRLALLGMSIATSVVILLFLIYILSDLSIRKRTFPIFLIKQMLPMAPLAGVFVLIRGALTDRPIFCFAAIALALSGFYAFAIYQRPHYKNKLVQFIKGRKNRFPNE